MKVNILSWKSLSNLLNPFTREFQLRSGAEAKRKPHNDEFPSVTTDSTSLLLSEFGFEPVFPVPAKTHGGELNLLAGQREMLGATRAALRLHFSVTVPPAVPKLRETRLHVCRDTRACISADRNPETSTENKRAESPKSKPNG